MNEVLQIRTYSDELYDVLADIARAVHVPALLNREFLDHYYCGQQWSKLFMAVDGSKCLGIIGVDMLDFRLNDETLKIAFATNFYSLQTGVGGMLWLKWIKMGDLGLVFGGSDDTHRIIRARNFDYYPGVNLYRMNARFENYENNQAITKIVKAGLRPWARKKLPGYASKNFLQRFKDVQVVERAEISEEMLATTRPFTFQFCPSPDYLQWRYNPRLTYLHYRVFEILRSGRSCGYCILNDSPTELMVVHSDGNDPESLAAGTLKAIFAVGEESDRYRKALLCSSHPAMQAIFTDSGFIPSCRNYSFAAGARKDPRKLGDPATWLINFGIGDNDLRARMFWPAKA